MSYPLGVVTRTITVGDSITVESGTDLTVRATLRSSRGLVWIATGERAVSAPEVRESAAAGDAVTFTSPVTSCPAFPCPNVSITGLKPKLKMMRMLSSACA